MGYRQRVLDHAAAFWWRPCADGLVWIKEDAIDLQTEANKLRLRKHSGAFLWYSPSKLEGLFLLPASQIAAAKNGKFEDFPSAVMLAAYSDNLADEAPAQTYLKRTLRTLPPYHGLDDCTHFTSECLISGGFPITDAPARRDAADLWRYLAGHHHVKILASEVTEAVASAAVSRGLLMAGDVIVYTNRDSRERHRGVVYLGDGTIAMHTRHQFGVPWQTAGGPDQLYTLFHISLDDSFVAPWASRWVGWWQLSAAGQNAYMYVGAGGQLTVTPVAPASKTAVPIGPNYWFADGSKMWTCIRLKGLVEEYTMDPDPMSATGAPANGGAPITARKL